jgi:hypothetical protein
VLLGPLFRFAENGEATIDMSDLAAAKAAFYADCTDVQVAAAADRLCSQPMANMRTPMSGDPMQSITTTYIACTEDRAIPLAAQRTMIAAVRATGVTINEIELVSSHSPFYSMPDRLADIIARVCTSI